MFSQLEVLGRLMMTLLLNQYLKLLKKNINITKKHTQFLKNIMAKKNLMTAEKKWQKCQKMQF